MIKSAIKRPMKPRHKLLHMDYWGKCITSDKKRDIAIDGPDGYAKEWVLNGDDWLTWVNGQRNGLILV